MEIKFSSLDLNGNGIIDQDVEKEKFKAALAEGIKPVIAQRRESHFNREKEKLRREIDAEALQLDQDWETNFQLSQEEFSILLYEISDKVFIKSREIEGFYNTIADKTLDSCVDAILEREEATTYLNGIIDKWSEQTGAYTESAVNKELEYLNDIVDKSGTIDINFTRASGFYLNGILILTATEPERDVYRRMKEADKDKDGRISLGEEMTNFFKTFSSAKNGILSPTDMALLATMTGFYFPSAGKRMTKSVDLNEKQQWNMTEDRPEFHRYTKKGESLVFGDLSRTYGA